ncbi:MAG: TolC family protein [Syntrophobacteraceae bacterium]
MRLKTPFVMAFMLVALGGCATYHAQPISARKSVAMFNGRSLESPGLRAFLEKNRVAAPTAGDAWNLKQLTLAAFYYQPALSEARARLLAAQAAEITAGERPNPSISVSPSYDSGIPGNFSPWLVPVSFDWPIETAGKRGYRMAGAQHLAEEARWDLVSTVWRVRSEVRAALLNLYAARQTESLLARQQKAERKVVRMLEGQFAAGTASSFEVTQARIALDTTTIARQAAAGRYLQARVALSAALGVPLSALDGVRLSFASLESFPRRLTRPEVRRRALLDRADVRSALADYAASQSELQLQIANQYPDVHLGPGYAWNNGNAGDSQWTLGVTLSLPILNQNQGPIAEASAKRKLAAAHFLTVQTAAVSQIESALAGYRSALKEVATTERLLKNLQGKLASVRAQVQAGEVEPLALANAEVAFNAGLQNRLDALIKAQQALGLLEDAVQSPLTLSASRLSASETPSTTNEEMKK